MVAGAVITIGGGVAKAISGGIQRKKAREEAAAAKAEYDKYKGAFSSLDTTPASLSILPASENSAANKAVSKNFFLGY